MCAYSVCCIMSNIYSVVCNNFALNVQECAVIVVFSALDNFVQRVRSRQSTKVVNGTILDQNYSRSDVVHLQYITISNGLYNTLTEFRFPAVRKMSEGQASQHSDDSLNPCVEIKGDQAANDSAAGRLNLSGINMWSLGVCISVSGIFYGWNVGLEAGFGSYIIARVLVSSAYIALLLCISELSSGLPFAGT